MDPNNSTSDTCAALSRHYDKRSLETRQERANSAAIGLRSANNRVKSLLIESTLRTAVRRVQRAARHSSALQRPIYVLDLGCGKGGDLPKWGAVSDALGCTVHYYGIDISPKSIAELHRRYKEARDRNRWPNLHVEAIAGDMCSVDTADFCSSWLTVDIVSAQFSLHYAFDDMARCRALFDNIGRFLALDGQLIATLIDDSVVKHRLCTESQIVLSDDGQTAQAVSLRNQIYSLTMSVDTLKRLAAHAHSSRSSCGLRYTFWLDACIDHCDEFVVERPFLLKMLSQIGLRLATAKNFGEIDCCSAQLSFEEQKIYTLYTALVFSK